MHILSVNRMIPLKYHNLYQCYHHPLYHDCMCQVFENETAQMLSKQMRNIERPSLSELNETIAANICPVFLPKYQPPSSSL